MKKSFRQFIAGLTAALPGSVFCQRPCLGLSAGPAWVCVLSAVAVFLTGCWTRIYTVAPTPEPVAPVKTVYTTQVTTPAPKVTTTTTVTVTSFNNDLSFYLDLNAVAAAFAESRSVQEFEQILNSPRYMINNLDLNRDGWIDYLRVLETRQGHRHVFLIQACLAPSMFQDVATLVSEWFADRLYVEVIGDRYLYGYNYIVCPVFVKRPPMWDVFGRPTYNPWVSPYHYGYLPSYYTKPKPIYLSHYQAYVNTYMTNHHYCHHCDHPQQPYWSGYSSLTQPNARQDYRDAHPNDSFEQRVTHQLTPNGSGVSVRNAGQLRTETQRQAASKAQSTTATRESTTTQSGTSTRQSSNTESSTRQSSNTQSSARQSSNTESSTRQSSNTQSSARQSSNTQSGNTRQSVTTQKREPSTTVNTRVNKSGTTRTTIKTTDSDGRTTTVKREANTQSTTRKSANTQSSTRQSSNTQSGARTRR